MNVFLGSVMHVEFKVMGNSSYGEVQLRIAQTV
jgi:hypothetical protein